MPLEAVHDTSAVLFTRSRVSCLPQRRELNRGSLRWILAGLRAVRFNSPHRSLWFLFIPLTS